MNRNTRSGSPRAAGDEDLEKIVTREGPLEVELARAIVAAAADVVGEAHGRGVVHGELAPHRIIVRARSPEPVAVRVRGLDRKAGGAGRSALFRPPAYLAPEQLGAEARIDARTDVWALGVILHEALTGALPFRAGSVPELCAAIVASTPASARALRPEVPSDLDAIIARCLCKDPAARFASMGALGAALRGASSSFGDATLVDDPRPITAEVRFEANTQIQDRAPIEARTHVAPRTASRGSAPIEPSLTATPIALPRPDPTRWIAALVASLAAVGLIAAWWMLRSPRSSVRPSEPAVAATVAPPLRAPPAVAEPSLDAPVLRPAEELETPPRDEDEPRPRASSSKSATSPRTKSPAGASAAAEPAPVTPPSPAPAKPAGDPYGGRK